MAAKNKMQEPAKISYFFGESYADLGRTIRDSWKANGSRISQAWSDLRGGSGGFYRKACLFLFRLAMLISIIVFGTLFTAVFSTVHILLLIPLMVLIYIGFVVLSFIDSVYCTIKGISNNCPTCERKFRLPVYVCPNPNCNAQHHRLIPSKYGILKRTCECGEKIPTTFFNGRQKLDALCPYCGNSVIKGAHRSLLVPVVGGANSGKTCFLTMSIDQISKKAGKLGLKYEYQKFDPKNHGSASVGRDEFEKNLRAMNAGMTPDKTSDMKLKYYNFFLSPVGDKTKNLISLCDIAGEVFDQNQGDLVKRQGYAFADGLIVIVDPFSILELKNEMKRTLPPHEYARIQASAQPISDVLNSLVNVMENIYRVDSSKPIKQNVAVVFTKCDIKALDERIGQTALDKYLSEHKGANVCSAYNALCEQFLLEYEEGNFLNTIKRKFTNVQFFACSAFGEQFSTKGYNPINVEYPTLWVIDKVNRQIDLSNIWGKKI